MRKSWLYMIAMGLVAAMLISGCAPATVETDEPEVEATEASEPTETATRTPSATPTITPTKTKTPTPTKTATPKPTRTPTATYTATIVPTRRPTSTVDPTNAVLTASAPAPTGTSTTTPTTAPVADNVPAGTSTWQMDNTAFETSRTAECTSEVQHDFYGLYRVTKLDGAIQWVGVDGTNFTLTRGNPNVYSGGGASVLPGYNQTVVAVFNSPTSLTATFILIDQAVAGCQHTYRYNAVPAF